MRGSTRSNWGFLPEHLPRKLTAGSLKNKLKNTKQLPEAYQEKPESVNKPMRNVRELSKEFPRIVQEISGTCPQHIREISE